MHFALLTAPLVAIALCATPASADPPSAALRLYAAGDYLAAAASAEAQASPTALVFAARARMAACMTSPHRREVDAWLAQAEHSAAEALSLDPTSVDARLQLAFTIGAGARRVSMPEAVARNYAPRGRRLIQEALARAPDHAEAHALLGAWHLEVLRRGGRAGAALYGARLETGIAEFERARDLAPTDALIAIEYAVALLQLDPDRFAPNAAALLGEAEDIIPSPDAFEAHARSQARHIAQVLAQEGPHAAERATRAVFL